MYDDFQAGIEATYWDAMRKGDKASYAWIYDKYFRLLYNYGRKIGIESEQLEDAIHDVFIDIWRSRENLAATTSVRFYLYRSLRRRVSRNSSKRFYFSGNEFIVDSLMGKSSPSSEDEFIDKEANQLRVHRLKKLLNDLAPRQYEALILRFYDELSYGEIAVILNVNEQSARNLIQRGLFQLRLYAKHIIPLVIVLLF
jgi:RNA polymerase sigma-70 factor (ECF subfamily)